MYGRADIQVIEKGLPNVTVLSVAAIARYTVRKVLESFGGRLYQKSGQRPCSVHVFCGNSCPSDSKPVYVSQN